VAALVAAWIPRAGARAQSVAAPPPVRVGQRAPAAPVTRLDGSTTNVAHYIGQRPVVIEFWGTWCGNCRALEPAMHAAHAALGDRVTFLTVAVSVDETPADVASYTRAHDYPPDVVFDPTGAAVDAYGAPGTSFVVVVDRSGGIVYTGSGGDQDLAAAIHKAL
jgi:thiol-disulfide isomerase/thioredoxin